MGEPTEKELAGAAWRAIPGWEQDFEVSDHGRVRAVQTQRIRATAEDHKGYLRIALRRGQRAEYVGVHGLVLRAFVGPRPAGYHAAHLDGDKRNNVLPNLAWVTPTENEAHKRAHGTARIGAAHPAAKLTAAQVAEIRAGRRDGIGSRQLARRYGVDRTTVQRIVRGARWAASPDGSAPDATAEERA